MATTTKTKTTKTTRTGGKSKAAFQERPEIPQQPQVDPFAAPPPAAASGKAAPTGDGVHAAPKDDPELGNVAHDIFEFTTAKAAMKAAEARFDAAKGTVMAFAKRVLVGLIARNGSKPKGQKLTGDSNSVVTTFYQDRVINVSDETYAALCEQFGKAVVDGQLVETSKTFTLNPAKVADPVLFEKIRKVLQSGLTAEELTGLFTPSGRTSQKGVVDQAAKLCNGDLAKIEQLLAVTVPTPTVK
jgi:hypothetical protein